MSRFLNTLASVTSLAAFAGVVYWGISLSQLDPNDVPVIKKAMGPARIAPDDPGGQQANFQGLSVNEIQTAGGAGKPADKIYLAPSPRPFQNEDIAGLKQPEPTNVIAQSDQSPVLKQNQFDPIPVSLIVDEPTELPKVNLNAPDAASVQNDETVSDVKQVAATIIDTSMRRPARRPSGLNLTTTKVNRVAATAKPSVDAKIAAGTVLVQLGAFDAEVVATVQWGALQARHADLLGSKSPLIQKAKKGSKTFYRLRISGFDNRDAARGLCTALKARGTDCIPVTTR